MPFGTVWQLDLAPAGGGGGGGGGGTGGVLGGVPGTPNLTPQRFSIQYTFGQGFFTPKMPTTAPAPLIGQQGEIPVHPYLFGVDFDESGSVNIPAMTAGQSMTVSQAVALPDIPTIQLDPTDSGSVQIAPQVYQNPIAPGLVIASVQCTAQVLQQTTGVWVSAATLSPGQAYTAVRAYFTVSLYAAANTVATTLTLGAATQVIIYST